MEELEPELLPQEPLKMFLLQEIVPVLVLDMDRDLNYIIPDI